MDLVKHYFVFILLLGSLIITQCSYERNFEEKKAILLADREAPLGWIYLRIYEDNTFEFESRGLERKGTIYPGTIKINNDTLVFNYTDSVPRAGKTAIISKASVIYLDGEYQESLNIKTNNIKK